MSEQPPHHPPFTDHTTQHPKTPPPTLSEPPPHQPMFPDHPSQHPTPSTTPEPLTLAESGTLARKSRANTANRRKKICQVASAIMFLCNTFL